MTKKTKKPVPIISVVGWSKSGKTSFLEKLIKAAIKRGLKVVAVKHTHHKIDEKKKDTFRLREAGADPVLLVSKELLILTKKVEDDLPLEKVVKDFVGHADIVFAEGFKGSKYPKIEVYSEKEEPLFARDSKIIAVITKKHLDVSLPTFSPDEPEKVMDFIIRKFSLVP